MLLKNVLVAIVLAMMFASCFATESDEIAVLRKAAETGDPEALNALAAALAPLANTAQKQVELLKLWQDAADAGYGPAINELGVLYSSGKVVAQDAAKALELFEQAAEAGYPLALYNLGSMHFSGSGVVKDIEKGLHYIRLAVDQEVPESQLLLGLIYIEGQVVERNPERGQELMTLAAEQGHAAAMLNLGALLIIGDKIGKDVAAGVQWTRQSSDAGNANAAYTLGVAYESGEYLPKDPDQAKRWYAVAADANLPLAAYRLAMLLDDSPGSAELDEAVRRFTQAAAAGQADSQYRLYQYYSEGLGVKKDPAIARQWLERAAQTGSLLAKMALDSELRSEKDINAVATEVVQRVQASAERGGGAAQAQLGNMYRFGEGIVRDRDQAIAWLSKAAEQGVLSAMADLGEVLQDWQADDDQQTQALVWLEAAAKEGNSNAQYRWGLALLKGDFVKQDEKQATHWLRRSAEQDQQDAKVAYAYIYFKGFGVKRNLTKAANWLAATDRDMYPIAGYYEDGDFGVPADWAFAHVLYGMAIDGEAKDHQRERWKKIGRKLNAGDRRASTQLTEALETADEGGADRWRRYLDESHDLMFDNTSAAENKLKEAQRVLRKFQGENHYNEAELLSELGLVAQIQGHLDDSTLLGHRAHELLMNHPETPTTMRLSETTGNLGSLIRKDPEAALEQIRDTLALTQRIYGTDSWRAAEVLITWGDALIAAKRPAEAIDYYGRALAVRRSGPSRLREESLSELDEKILEASDAAAEMDPM